MSHKLSELTHFFPDMFTCFTDPDEVVSDEEFEQMKQELSQQREKIKRLLRGDKDEESN